MHIAKLLFFQFFFLWKYLLVQEFTSVLLYVPFIQVCGEAHEAHFGQAKVCQLDVAHGGDEEAVRQKQSHHIFLTIRLTLLLSATQNI